MTAALLSFIQSGICHAGNFCKKLYPSYTTVMVNALDFRRAKTENLAPRELPEGVFAVIPSTDGEKSRGTLESGIITAAFPFDRLVLSINAFLPPRSFFTAEVQVGTADETGKPVWSRWYKIGKFTPNSASKSYGPQEDAFGSVSTDQLVLKKSARFCRFRVTLETGSPLMPVLRLAALNFSDSKAPYIETEAIKPLEETFPSKPAWLNPHRTLPVPTRSQRVEVDLDADSICSPVSLGMTMEYFCAKLSNTEIAGRVYDTKADIFGNWFFNTAFAGSKGMYSFVEKFNSLAEAERAIALGYPVTASITYAKGELKNAPVDGTKGHLVVIRGFDAKGGVLVNDPAANTTKAVPRRYNRKQFAAAWLKNKKGLAYRVEQRFPRVMRVGVPLAELRAQPTSTSTLESQFFLNEAVLVKSFKNGWAEVESLEQGYYTSTVCAPGNIGSCWQGYPGWLRADALIWGSAYGYGYTVNRPYTEALTDIDGKETPVKLYMGTRLCPVPPNGPKRANYTPVIMPGFAPLFVRTTDMAPCPDTIDEKTVREGVTELARQFNETPYLWGGRTTEGIDCSGLVNLVYRVYGVNLPRNADAQFRAATLLTGEKIKDAIAPGDLIFVSQKDNPGHMEHVLLYLEDDDLIEACRENGKVAETTFKKRLGKKLKKFKQGDNVDGHTIYFGKVF